MERGELSELGNVMLAPYIEKATALIGVPRQIGGNQFRHMMATLAILIDYKIVDPVMLKAAVIHDLLEDVEGVDPELILQIDHDGKKVLEIVKELTRNKNELKVSYLTRLRIEGSYEAKLVKLADRISNMTDLNADIFDYDFMCRYIKETEDLILPIAQEINYDMFIELSDLVKSRRKIAENLKQLHLVLDEFLNMHNLKDKVGNN